MGMFTKNQKATAENLYNKNIKPFLVEKDGMSHVVMVNSFSKWINNIFSCEDKYTTQMNEILACLQSDGYEVIDIKLGVIQDQGLSKSMEGFYSLIIYK